MRRISVGLLKKPIKQLNADQGNMFAQARAEEEAQIRAEKEAEALRNAA